MLIHRSPMESAEDLVKETDGFVICNKSFLDINSSEDHSIVATKEGLMTIAENYRDEDIKLCSECFFNEV